MIVGERYVTNDPEYFNFFGRPKNGTIVICIRTGDLPLVRLPDGILFDGAFSHRYIKYKPKIKRGDF